VAYSLGCCSWSHHQKRKAAPGPETYVSSWNNWAVHLTLLGKDFFFGGKKKALCQHFKKKNKNKQTNKTPVH